jgi:tRNA (guanine37-N1)-methyltransferase
MKFEIVTLFPDYFTLSLKQSLVGKAWEKKLFDISIVDLREFATDKHRTVDDTPYGGGGGMVLKVEPLDRCLNSLGWSHREDAAKGETEAVIMTSAAGDKLTQDRAIRYSLMDRVTIVCGHYQGVDERIMSLYDIEEVSIGDYILSGGEPAAAVIVDSVARLIPKVLGNFESAIEDSFMNDLLGAPSYTKPSEYKGIKVPEVLMSGNHAEIRSFRRTEAIRKCMERRPDLLESAELSDEDLKLIRSLKKNIES